MRISELAERTGVPIATLKYYLREGLLMPGEATSATRAEYGEEHLGRIRLVRALIEVGGLSLAGTRSVIATLEEPAEDVFELMGQAHSLLPAPEAAGSQLARVERLLADLGWEVGESNPGRSALGAALAAAESAGLVLRDDALRRYAEAAARIAEVDLDTALSAPDRDGVVHTVVVGTVMVDPVLSALRRLAQEAEAIRRLGSGTPGR